MFRRGGAPASSAELYIHAAIRVNSAVLRHRDNLPLSLPCTVMHASLLRLSCPCA